MCVPGSRPQTSGRDHGIMAPETADLGDSSALHGTAIELCRSGQGWWFGGSIYNRHMMVHVWSVWEMDRSIFGVSLPYSWVSTPRPRARLGSFRGSAKRLGSASVRGRRVVRNAMAGGKARSVRSSSTSCCSKRREGTRRRADAGGWWL